MEKKITLQHIAELANVSVGTVYKALHNQKGVGADKQQEILAIARSLNYYIPSTASPKSKKYTVAIVLPLPTSENRYFYQHLWDGIRERANELTAFRFQICEYGFEGGITQQLSMLQTILEHHVSEIHAVLTVMWNEAACLDLLNQFTQAGIKLFTLCAEAPSSSCTSTVMTNPYKTGRLAAEYLGSLLAAADSCRVIIVGTKRGTANHALIVRGFFDQMQEFNPLIEIIELYESVNYPQKLYSTLEDFLVRFHNIRGIYANNARTTVGICQMLEKLPTITKPVLVGSELFPESAAYLKKGLINGIIDQDGYALGYKGISVIFDQMILKKEVNSRYIMQQSLYLKNNLPESDAEVIPVIP